MSQLAAPPPAGALLAPSAPTPLAPPGPRPPVAVYLAQVSPASRVTLGRRLLAVARALGYPSPDAIPWATLTPGDMAALRVQLGEHLAPTTANLTLSAVRGVLKAAWQEGLLTSDQLARLSSVKGIGGKRLPPGRMLTSDECRLLFEQAARARPRRAARDAALLGLLLGGGLRISEPVGLDLSSLLPSHRDPQQVLVRGKGGKERLVPLPPGAQAAMRAWLAVRNLLPGPLLMSLASNDTLTRQRLTTNGATVAVLTLARKAGVEVSSHDFRRTALSALLDASADLSLVQRFAGHASPTTTARYDRRPHQAVVAAVAKMDVPYEAKP